MIDRSESGLTQEQYDALLAASGDIAASIKLQRLGPVWTDPGHTDAGSNTGLKAILFDGHLVRAFNNGGTLAAEKLANESAGNQDWMSVGTHSDIGITLMDVVTDGSTLRLFFQDSDDKIAYSDCTDLDVGFGAPTAVGAAITRLIHLAASTITTVHYINRTSDKNRRFHVGQYSNTWQFTDSDILYPFPIDSMSAIQRSDGVDVIALAATLSPLIGNRVVGVEITQETETVQGIVTFLYNNERWSDHYVTDVTDNIADLPGRSDIRLSYYNDIIFLTYERHGGSDTVNYRKCAVSRSTTGKFFEFPELVVLDTPAILIPRSDYLYLVGKETRRSSTCQFGGQTPIEQDITDYVLQASSEAGDIRQTMYNMADVAQSDGSHSLDSTLSSLAVSQRMQVIYNLGYWIDGSELLVQVGTEDVVSVEESTSLPVHRLSLVAMDRLSRLNRIASDHAAEFPGMEIGRDPLDDPTGTGWGGMRHLASYKPSWKASSGVLNLVSNNKEGLAVSTFVVDTLNGTISTGFSLGFDDRDEYAGVVFRTYDKNTLFYVAYHPDEAQVQLYKRKGVDNDEGFEDTLVDYIDTSGWAWTVAEGTYYYLRAWAYYGRLYLYRSTDGIIWSAVSWNGSSQTHTELPGQPEAGQSYRMWSGKLGVIGYGYSDQDETPWVIDPWLPPVPTVGLLGVMMACGNAALGNQVAVSFDFFDGTPTWYDADPNGDLVGVLQSIAVYGLTAYATTKDDSNQANTGLFYCADTSAAEDASISWALIKSVHAAAADTGYLPDDASCSCCFGALDTNDAGEVCALVHSANTGMSSVPQHGLDPHSGAYIGSSGSVSFSEFNDVPGKVAYPFHQERPGNATLHSVYGGSGSWYVAGKIWQSPSHKAYLAYGGTSWSYVDFWTVPAEAKLIAASGDGGGYTIGQSGQVYANWGITPITDLIIERRSGIWEDYAGTYRLYLEDDNNFDLYQNGVLIGDANTAASGFGTSKQGSMAQFVPGSSSEIVWVVGNGATFSTDRAIIYTDSNGAAGSWQDKTGNLATALSTLAWNGWSGQEGNSVMRIFEY